MRQLTYQRITKTGKGLHRTFGRKRSRQVMRPYTGASNTGFRSPVVTKCTSIRFVFAMMRFTSEGLAQDIGQRREADHRLVENTEQHSRTAAREHEENTKRFKNIHALFKREWLCLGGSKPIPSFDVRLSLFEQTSGPTHPVNAPTTECVTLVDFCDEAT